MAVGGRLPRSGAGRYRLSTLPGPSTAFRFAMPNSQRLQRVLALCADVLDRPGAERMAYLVGVAFDKHLVEGQLTIEGSEESGDEAE